MRNTPMFVVTALLVGVVALTAASSSAQSGLGPPGGTIYVDDMAFQTMATPRDLPPNGPFDVIYVLGDGLASVAEAKPGDQDYNGGRWEVREVTFVNIAPTQFTNVEALRAAEMNGEVSFSDVVRRFECPLIRK